MFTLCSFIVHRITAPEKRWKVFITEIVLQAEASLVSRCDYTTSSIDNFIHGKYFHAVIMSGLCSDSNKLSVTMETHK